MLDWLRDLWTRIVFALKPTYYVFASVQDAVDALPGRGGTLLFGAGEFHVGKDGVEIPNKDIRMIGGVFRMGAESQGFKIKHCKRAVFVGCSFIGPIKGSVFTEER